MKNRVTKIKDESGKLKARVITGHSEGDDISEEDHDKLTSQARVAAAMIRSSVQLCEALSGIDIRNMPNLLLNEAGTLTDDLASVEVEKGNKGEAVALVEVTISTLEHLHGHFVNLHKRLEKEEKK